MTFAAFLISLIALVVSIFAARYAKQSAQADALMASIEQGRRDDEIAQSLREEIFQLSTVITASASPPEQNTDPSLIITNIGKAAARNVSVHVGGPGIDPRAQPVTRDILLPRERWDIDAVGNKNLGGRNADLTRAWEDGAGIHEHAQTIAFPELI